MKVNKEKVLLAFDKYVASYNANDPKIKLKIDHTYRVADLCEQIAKSISLSDEEIDLAWLCGMLHDIGRFEQVKRYGTYNDAESIDHAQFGADLLFWDGLVNRFVEFEKEDKEIDILEKAIRNHSLFEIEQTLSETEKLFCHILRDADKIDILRANCDTPIEDVYSTPTDVLRKEAVTKEVKEAFDHRQTVLRSIKKTTVDHVVGHASLMFGLEFLISKNIVKEQGYLLQLLMFESDNEDTASWFEHMRQTLKGEFTY